MTRFLIVVLLTTTSVLAETAQPAQPISKPPSTDREQVQADRARAAAEEKNAPTTRPWDRDANGKRPWEKPAVPK